MFKKTSVYIHMYVQVKEVPSHKYVHNNSVLRRRRSSSAVPRKGKNSETRLPRSVRTIRKFNIKILLLILNYVRKENQNLERHLYGRKFVIQADFVSFLQAMNAGTPPESFTGPTLYLNYASDMTTSSQIGILTLAHDMAFQCVHQSFRRRLDEWV